jgi:hypothetical protein
MPSFYNIDVDIDVDEFLEECDDSEIEEIVAWLKNNYYIPKDAFIPPCKTYLEQEWDETVEKIRSGFIRMSKEDEYIIKQIANKF